MHLPRYLDVGMWLAILAFVLGIVWFAGLAIMELNGEAACLRHGYPKAQITAAYTVYCVRRDDGTDHITPLDELGHP